MILQRRMTRGAGEAAALYVRRVVKAHTSEAAALLGDAQVALQADALGDRRPEVGFGDRVGQ